MRNSNCMAIAPTVTISSICGVAQSIEPAYQNRYVKSNMSGDFTVVNEWMSEAMDSKKEKNFLETRVIGYPNGGALSWLAGRRCVELQRPAFAPAAASGQGDATAAGAISSKARRGARGLARSLSEY
jgi:ribonucleotide reductase alpha subunit